MLRALFFVTWVPSGMAFLGYTIFIGILCVALAIGTSSTTELIGSVMLQGEHILSNFGSALAGDSGLEGQLDAVWGSGSGAGRLSLLPADGVVSSTVVWQELARLASVLHLALDSLPAVVLELEGTSFFITVVCLWAVVGLLGASIIWLAFEVGFPFSWWA